MSGSSSRAASLAKGWQPWGNGSGSFRGSASSGGGPSASLGGLWKLMSLSRPGHGGGTATVVSSSAPKAQKPSRPSAPKPSHPAPPAHVTAGSPTLAAPAATPVSGVAATDPFHEHETPSPAPFSPPSSGGTFDPGRPGGGGIGTGGGVRVSATPEPGSMLLLGTGLLGILGVMRKRRLI